MFAVIKINTLNLGRMESKIKTPKTGQQQENMSLSKILSHDFAAYESVVIDNKNLNLQSFKILIIKNRNGETAEFIWQKNSISENQVEGYLKEMINNLGVKFNHNGNSVVIINGGAEQYLRVELKVNN
jgi:hypothetical protein